METATANSEYLFVNAICLMYSRLEFIRRRQGGQSGVVKVKSNLAIGNSQTQTAAAFVKRVKAKRHPGTHADPTSSCGSQETT